MNGRRFGLPRGPLWRHPDFLRLWAAQAISSVGARVARDGLPLTAVIALHAGPQEIGRLAAVSAAPALAVGLLAGGSIDRAGRRGVLIAADLGRAAVLLIVPLAAFAHRLVLAEVYLAAVAMRGLSTLFDMADHAYLPALVSRELVLDANAKLAATDALGEIGGPAIAGALVSALTAPIAIAVNALTYLASAALLATIRAPDLPVATTTSRRAPWRADLMDGLRATFAQPVVRSLFLVHVTWALFGSFFAALYIVFAIRTLGLSPALLGLTIAMGGVGALLGAAMTGWLGRRLGIGPAFIAVGLANALIAGLIPLAGGGVALAMAMLMVAQLFGDAVGTAEEIYATSARQALLPLAALARAAGLFAAGAGAASIAGALLGGWLGQTIGARPTLLIACAGIAVGPLLCLGSPLRRLRDLPSTPA